MIADFEIAHGMIQGKDFEIVAVVHSGGGRHMLKDSGTDGNGNPVQEVKDRMAAGVDFCFCQNTTAGVTSIAEFQQRGHELVQR